MCIHMHMHIRSTSGGHTILQRPEEEGSRLRPVLGVDKSCSPSPASPAQRLIYDLFQSPLRCLCAAAPKGKTKLSENSCAHIPGTTTSQPWRSLPTCLPHGWMCLCFGMIALKVCVLGSVCQWPRWSIMFFVPSKPLHQRGRHVHTMQWL